MMQFYKLIATSLGVGYLPVAPGTWGALFAFNITYVLHINGHLSNPLLIFLVIAFTLLGTLASYKLKDEWGKDPSITVIDEVVGYWISLIFVPFHLYTFIAAFILFRIFDISKPLFIRKLEELPYGFGVMADDLLAGVYANICLQFLVISFLHQWI